MDQTSVSACNIILIFFFLFFFKFYPNGLKGPDPILAHSTKKIKAHQRGMGLYHKAHVRGPKAQGGSRIRSMGGAGFRITEESPNWIGLSTSDRPRTTQRRPRISLRQVDSATWRAETSGADKDPAECKMLCTEIKEEHGDGVVTRNLSCCSTGRREGPRRELPRRNEAPREALSPELQTQKHQVMNLLEKVRSC